MSGLPMTIRPLAEADRPSWEPLWQGYQAFYKVDLPASATQSTWARFFDPTEPVHALVAEEGDALIGLAHYLFHRSTWTVEPVCYLHDLFTLPAARGRGVGRALIEGVYDRAREAGAPRVYWLTHETNTTARALYDAVAERSGFLHYHKVV